MFVVGEGGAGGEVDLVPVPGVAIFMAEPADDAVGGGFDAGFGVVFGLEAGLDDFELQGANGSEEGDALHVLGS